MVMGLSGLSDSSHKSCAIMEADTVSLTAPLRQMIRSYICGNRGSDGRSLRRSRVIHLSVPEGASRKYHL